MVYFLLTIATFTGMCSTALVKKYQLSAPDNKLNFVIYCMITSFVASLFFYFSGKFQISFNLVTFAYAMVYAIFCTINVINNVIAFGCIGIVLTNILSSSGRIFIPAVYGFVFLNEHLSIWIILSILFVLLASILPFLGKSQERLTRKGVIITIITFLMSGLGVILSKMYVMDTRTVNNNSYFFLTNIIILGGMIIYFIYLAFKDKNYAVSCIKEFKPKHYAEITSITVCGNIGAILQLVIIKIIPVSLYSQIISSMNIIGGAAVTRVVFKDALDIKGIISIILCIASIILSRIN